MKTTLQRILQLYNKASLIFIISVGIITLGIAEYYVDIKPPSFRAQLIDSLTDNKNLMNRIGDWNQTQFQYSDSLENNNTFKIIITGKCDSALIAIKGKYTGNIYTITDTIIRNCK